MPRARSDVAVFDQLVRDSFAVMKSPALHSKERVDAAITSLETFAVVALRVMAKTNPSKIRGEALTVEIKARLDGTPVIGD